MLPTAISQKTLGNKVPIILGFVKSLVVKHGELQARL